MFMLRDPAEPTLAESLSGTFKGTKILQLGRTASTIVEGYQDDDLSYAGDFQSREKVKQRMEDIGAVLHLPKPSLDDSDDDADDMLLSGNQTGRSSNGGYKPYFGDTQDAVFLRSAAANRTRRNKSKLSKQQKQEISEVKRLRHMVSEEEDVSDDEAETSNTWRKEQAADKKLQGTLNSKKSHTKSATQLLTSREALLEQKGILKAKFQIGSLHGRVSYKRGERVFHQSDVPSPARHARNEVAAMLKPKPQKHAHRPDWDLHTHGVLKSGKVVAPWDTDVQHDRIYKKMDADQKVKAQQRRINMIRKGQDPDKDHKAVNPKWQQSTLVMPMYKQQYREQKAPKPKYGRVVPQNRMSLVARTTVFNQTLAAQKRKAREAQDRSDFHKTQSALAQTSNSLYPGEDWGDHSADTANGERLDAATLKARLEATYNADTLAEFLKSQEEDMERDAMLEKEGQVRSRSLNGTMSIPPVKGKPRTTDAKKGSSRRFKPGESAYVRFPHNDLAPVFHYEHRGVWAHNAIQDAEAWSCCMSLDRTGRGCTKVKVAAPHRWNLSSS